MYTGSRGLSSGESFYNSNGTVRYSVSSTGGGGGTVNTVRVLMRVGSAASAQNLAFDIDNDTDGWEV